MKKGFTLAEVLITLGVIGVVAAITMPVLVKNYKKHVTEKRLLRVYTTIEQALKMSDATYGDLSTKQFAGVQTSIENNSKIVNTCIMPYLSSAKIKSIPYGQVWKTFGYKDIKDFPATWTYNGPAIILKTGEILAFYTQGGVSGASVLTIGVDINGTKGPNKIGIDGFNMAIPLYNGMLLMRGEKTTKGNSLDFNVINSLETIINNCKNTGDTCGAWIKQNGWKIPDDYPW